MTSTIAKTTAPVWKQEGHIIYAELRMTLSELLVVATPAIVEASITLTVADTSLDEADFMFK